VGAPEVTHGQGAWLAHISAALAAYSSAPPCRAVCQTRARIPALPAGRVLDCGSH